MKKKVGLIFLISTIIITIVTIFQNGDVFAKDTEVYDVILFWGQSNMQGLSSSTVERFDSKNEQEVENFSKATGIDKDILSNTTNMNYTKVEQQAGTVYEYKYLTNSIEELSSNTTRLGESLQYNSITGKLETSVGGELITTYESTGINMIPEFCRTYYERTGRKVVAVMCAAPGQRIETFLPVNDADHISGGDANYSINYLYEGMVEKYRAAISYLENEGFEIGNKLWVSCQGEANVINYSTDNNYEEKFLRIHNNLKKDIGITKGAIVKTAITIGNLADRVEEISKKQQSIIDNNEDIILGSAYLYERYVPDKDTYESSEYKNENFVDSSGNKLSYTEAFNNASYSVCYPDNTIHFTSAALSQVGREVATAFTEIEEISVTAIPTKSEYIQNNEDLVLDGAKLSVKYFNGMIEEIDMNNSSVEVTGFDNTTLGDKTLTATYKGKSTTFSVKIIGKQLSEIVIKQLPTKTEYIQNYEQLNLTEGKIILKYNDETSEEIEMIDEGVTVTGFDNATLGSKTLTVTYGGKTASFSVEVVRKSVTEIQVKNTPTQTKYIKNYESLNLEGGIIIVKYNDETTQEVEMTNSNITVTGFDNTTIGNKQITIIYEEKMTVFSIEIVDKSIEEVEIKNKPLQLEYILNYEQLNLAGGVLKVKYKDNTEQEIEMNNEQIQVSGFDNSKLGKQLITLIYSDKNVSFEVEIVNKSATSIEVKNTPIKCEYIQNYEDLELEGGVILVKYNNETSQEIQMTNQLIETTGFDNSKLGNQTITIKYDNKITTFVVQIVEKSVERIEIKELPNKLKYIEKTEKLDLTGGEIIVKYNDNSEEVLKMNDERIVVVGFDNTKIGEKIIQLEYKGKVIEFEIEIVKKEGSFVNPEEELDEKDNTIVEGEIPQAGSGMAIFIAICTSIGLAVFFKIKYDRIHIK